MEQSRGATSDRQRKALLAELSRKDMFCQRIFKASGVLFVQAGAT
jgi:hypothetical protein